MHKIQNNSVCYILAFRNSTLLTLFTRMAVRSQKCGLISCKKGSRETSESGFKSAFLFV